MIEEDDYLSAEVFDKFSQSPQSFAAMPWFMDIYYEYKERMQEPNFEAIEIEEPKQSEAEPQVQQTEPIEKVEGEVIDQSGNIIKPAVFNASYPKALEQVEGGGA